MFVRAVFSFCLLATPLFASQIRFVPVAERVAVADIIVVGTVTEVEEEPINIELYGPGAKTRLRVAKVKIEENLLGADGLTQLRVAFTGAENQPKDGLKIPTPVLEKDNKVLLFLRKVPGEDVAWLWGHFGAVGKNPTNPFIRGDLDETIKEAKPFCKVMGDPLKSLKSEKAEDRMLAAYMLANRYQARPLGRGFARPEKKPIEAGESKLIMEGLLLLAEKNPDAFAYTIGEFHLEKEDGFEGSVWADGGRERAKKWVKDNVDKYRVKKLVPTEK